MTTEQQASPMPDNVDGWAAGCGNADKGLLINFGSKSLEIKRLRHPKNKFQNTIPKGTNLNQEKTH